MVLVSSVSTAVNLVSSTLLAALSEMKAMIAPPEAIPAPVNDAPKTPGPVMYVAMVTEQTAEETIESPIPPRVHAAGSGRRELAAPSKKSAKVDAMPSSAPGKASPVR